MATKKKMDTAPQGEFFKENSVVRDESVKMSANDLVAKRVAKRLDCTIGQAKEIIVAVTYSQAETAVIKGSLTIPNICTIQTELKPASDGIINFGDKKGEKWEKDAYVGVKSVKVNNILKVMANDNEELDTLDSLTSIWGSDDTEEVGDDEVEAPAPKKAPAKKTPTRKAPTKRK